jgi:hypothetical protein
MHLLKLQDRTLIGDSTQKGPKRGLERLYNHPQRLGRAFWRISRRAMEESARKALYLVKIKNHSFPCILARYGAIRVFWGDIFIEQS